ncbi:hypothetical protein [uncultured Methanolobus sp.]|uniref:hypothetical protein n=1 Tax=uncultured Methanolobus sp. TaxID=218300 RepID=UPI0029C5FEB4|nr:hypothetical protein [uncultured Methanolobus sp.]
MVSTENVFLFYGAGALGLIAGIFGNLFVTSMYNWFDDPKNKIKALVFGGFTLATLYLLWYMLDGFLRYAPLAGGS